MGDLVDKHRGWPQPEQGQFLCLDKRKVTVHRHSCRQAVGSYRSIPPDYIYFFREIGFLMEIGLQKVYVLSTTTFYIEKAAAAAAAAIIKIQSTVHSYSFPKF